MINDAPSSIQKVIDRGYARDIAKYVERRNRRRPEHKATLRLVCKRFRINQSDAVRIIENSHELALSIFAYKPPADDANDGEILFASFHPQYWPDAPLGRRLVTIIEEIL